MDDEDDDVEVGPLVYVLSSFIISTDDDVFSSLVGGQVSKVNDLCKLLERSLEGVRLSQGEEREGKCDEGEDDDVDDDDDIEVEVEAEEEAEDVCDD